MKSRLFFVFLKVKRKEKLLFFFSKMEKRNVFLNLKCFHKTEFWQSSISQRCFQTKNIHKL